MSKAIDTALKERTAKIFYAFRFKPSFNQPHECHVLLDYFLRYNEIFAEDGPRATSEKELELSLAFDCKSCKKMPILEFATNYKSLFLTEENYVSECIVVRATEPLQSKRNNNFASRSSSSSSSATDD
jgi:hypothetical protein